jgi:RimJ/RimL family protein N-acetyltransferase
VEDTRRLMSEQTAGADNFVVTLSGEPIGVAGVKHPGSGDKPRVMPRLGYWIGRPYWGRGHATEAVGALVAEAFARFPDAQRIGAGVFEDNPASQRVLEKLGFERIGGYTLHCRARDNGVYTHDMNLTRERWASARAEGA